MVLYHPPWMVGTLVSKDTCSHLGGAHPSLKKETEVHQSEILPLQQNSVQSRDIDQGSFSPWYCYLQSLFSRKPEPKVWQIRGPRKGSLCAVVEVHFDLGFQIRRRRPSAFQQAKDASLWGDVQTNKIPLQSQPLSKHLWISQPQTSVWNLTIQPLLGTRQGGAWHLEVTVTDGAIVREKLSTFLDWINIWRGKKVSRGWKRTFSQAHYLESLPSPT